MWGRHVLAGAAMFKLLLGSFVFVLQWHFDRQGSP
jgi:hypothetical protein